MDRLGRYVLNGGRVGGKTTPPQGCGAENGTAIVGSYAPNSWGIYDMHGNVWEWCLDWYEDDILKRDGAVNVNASNSANTLSGASGSNRVRRGGSWNSTAAAYCRSAYRYSAKPADRSSDFGVRVVCTAGLR